ncbi:MAG: SDR family oxidoreductase [Caulobacteraceae bacterium]|nr:SDR family oxidoreductase [Caulobacteraceae bacterium]
MSLSGKHALVTGGGTGIGAATAKWLAAQGAQVTLLGRRLEPLQAVAAEIGRQAFAATADVTDAGAVENAFGASRERFGRHDILVNNAGIARGGPFLRQTDEDWSAIFATNLFSIVTTTKLALPGMLESGWGRVVNVASIAGLRGSPYTTAYTASKHALVGLTRSLALEVWKKGVTVNAVCPGYVDTPMTDQTVANIQKTTGRSEAEARAEIEKLGPRGRMLTSEEVASSIGWLCLEPQSAISGATIPVGGDSF